MFNSYFKISKKTMNFADRQNQKIVTREPKKISLLRPLPLSALSMILITLLNIKHK